jgi:hypothetical protein
VYWTIEIEVEPDRWHTVHRVDRIEAVWPLLSVYCGPLQQPPHRVRVQRWDCPLPDSPGWTTVPSS